MLGKQFIPYIGSHRLVEMVPTGALGDIPGNDLRHSPEYLEHLYTKIREQGFHDPLWLQYGTGDRTVRLGEGNHRRAMAVRFGITHLPVTVEKRIGTVGGKLVKGFDPDESGYVPGNMRPSQIMHW